MGLAVGSSRLPVRHIVWGVQIDRAQREKHFSAIVRILTNQFSGTNVAGKRYEVGFVATVEQGRYAEEVSGVDWSDCPPRPVQPLAA